MESGTIYPIAEFLHLDAMSRSDCALMVAENGNSPIGIVVVFDLFMDTASGRHLL
jgi:hypothetical protein